MVYVYIIVACYVSMLAIFATIDTRIQEDNRYRRTEVKDSFIAYVLVIMGMLILCAIPILNIAICIRSWKEINDIEERVIQIKLKSGKLVKIHDFEDEL